MSYACVHDRIWSIVDLSTAYNMRMSAFHQPLQHLYLLLFYIIGLICDEQIYSCYYNKESGIRVIILFYADVVEIRESKRWWSVISLMRWHPHITSYIQFGQSYSWTIHRPNQLCQIKIKIISILLFLIYRKENEWAALYLFFFLYSLFSSVRRSVWRMTTFLYKI